MDEDKVCFVTSVSDKLTVIRNTFLSKTLSYFIVNVNVNVKINVNKNERTNEQTNERTNEKPKRRSKTENRHPSSNENIIFLAQIDRKSTPEF